MMPALHKTNKPCFTLLTFFNATNFLFFGFTRPGIKTTIYGTHSELANNYIRGRGGLLLLEHGADSK
jgi:hypothetical protein